MKLKDNNETFSGYTPNNGMYNGDANNGYNQMNNGYNQMNNGYTPGYNNGAGGMVSVHGADYNTISDTNFNLIIGGTLLYGFIMNILMVALFADSIISFAANSIILFFVSYFIMVMAGVTMVNKSDNPVISFIGYNLIVIPIGMVIAVVVETYFMAGYSSVVTAAFAITAVVTFAMMFISSIFPSTFLSMGRTLFITLIITIIAELIFSFLGASLAIFDYVVVIIFCGYIGYDWAKANAKPKTVDSAIDAAADLYVDIANLFLRILRILGRARN